MALKEGAVTNSIFKSRMINSNGNLIMVVVGKVGAGKSYWCLRASELWYEEYFNEEFPTTHICFTIKEVMNLLAKGNLRRGDIVIMEEAGTSMNNLDFQNKISKVFNLVLQTFRNKHICLMMNLPFIALLNKTSRTLMHMQVTMKSLDEANKISKAKVLHVQVNQDSGKVYRHFPRLLVDGCMEPIPEVSFSMPSKKLVDEYERVSNEFKNKVVDDVLKQVSDEDGSEKDFSKLSDQDGMFYQVVKENPGKSRAEYAELLGITIDHVRIILSRLRRKGFSLENDVKPTDFMQNANKLLGKSANRTTKQENPNL